MKLGKVLAAIATLTISLIIGWMGFALLPTYTEPSSIATTTPPVATSTPATTTTPVITSKEVRKIAYTTAYTWYDNTPPGSAAIAFAKSYGYPTAHESAGGIGTYADPITIAVGHVNTNGVDTPDFAPGTRFYIPNVRAYFMVEDTCGDGDRPQDGPCHRLDTPGNEAPRGAELWLDLWIEGEKDGVEASNEVENECASALTENHLVIINPNRGYAVIEGPLVDGGVCREQFGDTIVKQ